MKNISRRNMLKKTGGSLGMAVLGVPIIASVNNQEKQKRHTSEIKKILVIGAHPDDAETACGGTITLLSKAGHNVVSAYLTRGEAGIKGKTHDQAGKIRTKEAINACKIMGARPEFIGQIDGNTEVNIQRYNEMFEFIQKENPDIVITHWPIDGHRDHRACSILVYDAWKRMNRNFDLYYFEIDAGDQTQQFAPSDFVDIGSVIEEKHKACRCHISQGMERVLNKFHFIMEKFHGIQNQCTYAEAFIRHQQVQSELMK